MGFNRIQNTFSSLFTHVFWAYLALVAFHHFGQPIFLSAEAASVAKAESLPSKKLSTSPSTVTPAPYVRKSRDTGGFSATSAPEYMDGQDQFGALSSSALSSHSEGGRFFPYPSFKHKYQPRVARFHGESSRSYPATRTYSIRSMTSFPKLNPLAGILSMKSSEVRNLPLDELEEEDPTFTPYISARAMSNLPQFFQHLRDNLEALQFDDEDEDGEGNSGNDDGLLGQSGDWNDGSLNIPHPPEKSLRWRPPTAGMTGRAHIRHFVNDPVEQDLFYRKPAHNPARNVYEFGLG